MTRALARFYWAGPAVLALVLSAYQITRPALWADELATWGAVRLSWGALFRLLGNVDAVVGPYYALMKLWTGVAGTSTLALRLPSLLVMELQPGPSCDVLIGMDVLRHCKLIVDGPGGFFTLEF